MKKKQEEAEFTKDTIKVLVQNILPVHVAEIYMNRQIKDELYYEEYDNVAIMFATITNYDIASESPGDTDKNILNILNRIICDFDEQLLMQIGKVKIEKIKVAGWTYMVACGLDPGRGDSCASLLGGRGLSVHRESVLSNGRRSCSDARFNSKLDHQHSLDKINLTSNAKVRIEKGSFRKNQNVVYVLAQFALEIMRALNYFNQENFKTNGKLRIGNNKIKQY